MKNPPRTIFEILARREDARQMQYNRWSKRYRVYSGSYFPENHSRLLKKGWVYVKPLQNGGMVIQRKSSGQTIRSDWHGKPHHYHWLDFWEKPFVNARYRKFKKREFSGERVYYNKHGQLTRQGDPEHHLYGDKRDN